MKTFLPIAIAITTLVLPLAAKEWTTPKLITSPNGEYSVRMLDSKMKTAPEDEFFTLQVWHKDKLILQKPTVGYLLAAYWTPENEMVAINNRRGNSGDYLWVISLPDCRILKQPDDRFGQQWLHAGVAVMGKKHGFNPDVVDKSWLTSGGWNDQGELKVSIDISTNFPPDHPPVSGVKTLVLPATIEDGKWVDRSKRIDMEAMPPEPAGTGVADDVSSPLAVAQSDDDVIRTLLKNELERDSKDGVKLSGEVKIDGAWARFDGNAESTSGRRAKHPEIEFDLDLTAVFKKAGGEWKLLKYVFAGDISASIVIPEEFPDVSRKLFPPIREHSEPEPASDHYEFIDGESNMRDGPGTKYPVLFQPAKGTRGIIVDRRDKWVRIQLDGGGGGWVHLQNLRKVP